MTFEYTYNIKFDDESEIFKAEPKRKYPMDFLQRADETELFTERDSENPDDIGEFMMDFDNF